MSSVWFLCVVQSWTNFFENENQSKSNTLAIKMASHVYKLGVHKIAEVESMANYFENTPKYTRWTAVMKLKAAFWMVAFPAGLYAVLRPLYVRISNAPKIDPRTLTCVRNGLFLKPKMNLRFFSDHSPSFAQIPERS